MKERPILFSAPMVRALLDGSKTQTRRVVKPPPEAWGHGGLALPGYCASTDSAFKRGAPIFKSTFGKAGDLLWVRETFAPIFPQSPDYNSGQPIEYDYRATYTHGDRLGDTLGIKKRWTPSIHMPRSASRITLEITGVRVERLQDISDTDALAEGVDRTNTSIPGYAKQRFHRLWESINGPGSWDANPWVWVVEFKRIEA